MLQDHARHGAWQFSYKIPLPLRRPSLHTLVLHSGICAIGRCFICEGWAVGAMVGFRRFATLWSFGLMVVLVGMALHASAADAEQPCSVKALYPCLVSAKGPYPPVPDERCCTAVKEADPGCLCREFVKTKLSDDFVHNVLAMPKACGRTQLSGTRCGSYIFE